MEDQELHNREFCDIVDEMTKSMSSVREVVKSLRDKQTSSNDLDTKDGISLLSLKHHLLLSYLQSLTLLSARRALGHSLTDRSPPTTPFSSIDRAPRGSGAGDLVDSMVETRIVLEKIKALESRMKYQIEKLVKAAEEEPSKGPVTDDPLSFRPNPQNLMNDDNEGGAGNDPDDGEDEAKNIQDRDGIYRPPRLAAMPYTEAPRDKKSRRKPLPSALTALMHQDPSRPHLESTSGLASMPSLSSNRAREIQRMNEFEEENFTRIIMKKKDAKRRHRDEQDIALGGSGGISGRRRGGGFEDEFADVLRSVGRSNVGIVGDGYEELRNRGKRGDVLARSMTRPRDEAFDEMGDVEPRLKKRSRFEKEAKATKKKLLRSRKPT